MGARNQEIKIVLWYSDLQQTEVLSMTDLDYDEAAMYWQKKDVNNEKMPEDKLKKAIETFAMENNTLALATGGGVNIRCTPLEYTYHDGAFWIFTEGGRKFLGLKENNNVCAAIYRQYEGFGNLAGLQVTGIAEMIEPFSEEYVENARFKKIPIEALKKLESPMHLIKIMPVHYDFLNSAFKKDGYSSRQEMNVE